eukprot:m.90364 g.90364  ORF g.90364 m.90364 type:complete len:545 (+) comp21579_c0_seq1:729-2363(+)
MQKQKMILESFLKTQAEKIVEDSETQASNHGWWQPFHLQDSMRLAPVHVWANRPRPTSVAESLTRSWEIPDNQLPNRETLLAGLSELKGRARKPEQTTSHRSDDTDSAKQLTTAMQVEEDGDEDEVVAFDAPNLPRMRMKLLQFWEDVRPPYYGTFSKQSAKITARRPLNQDTEIFDYDYDSEAEWEPEDEEGEDCLSADEKSDESGDEEEEAEAGNWLVPHGYLSEGEGVDDDDEDLDLGMDNIRKVLKSDDRSDERGTKQKLKPPLSIGCVWGADAKLHRKLGSYSLELLVPAPIPLIPILEPPEEKSKPKPKPAKPVPKKFSWSNTILADLVKIVHGSKEGMPKIIAEFQEQHPDATKAAIKKKIKEETFCIREKREPYQQQRRFVLASVLKELDLSTLPLPAAELKPSAAPNEDPARPVTPIPAPKASPKRNPPTDEKQPDIVAALFGGIKKKSNKDVPLSSSMPITSTGLLPNMNCVGTSQLKAATEDRTAHAATVKECKTPVYNGPPPPAPWQVYFDDSNDPYFYNDETKESRWELPE